MNSSQTANASTSNRKTVLRLLFVAGGMFGFGFAMVPLYSVFCDLTGFGGRGVKVAESAAGVGTSDREVRVQFVATTNSKLPWVFQPVEKNQTVRLGELSRTLYLALNPTDRATVGHAVFNVTPPEASLYFVKTECFCFREQLLDARESREMPVYFFIQPDLPAHIRDITLSYTFYLNGTNESLTMATGQAVQ